MEGIYKVADFEQDINVIKTRGFDRGHKIGFPSLDQLYRIKRGMFTVVTGIPGHGKSEVVDMFVISLILQFGWKFAFFSPENYPLSLHFVKLIEKVTGKPFAEISKKEYADAKSLISSNISWLYPDEEKEPISLDNLLDKARYLVESEGLDGFILDPWNEVEHNRGSLSETDYISQSLSKIRRFARKHDVHVWIIAHPTKLQKDRQTGQYPVPTPYDISGSSHWRNKLDFCLTVHRPNIQVNEIVIYVQKVKFKQLGKIGQAELFYNYESGTFSDKSAGEYNPYG